MDGVWINGSADCTVIYSPSNSSTLNGVWGSGLAPVTAIYTVIPTSGVWANGTPIVSYNFIPSGGVWANGIAVFSLNYIPSGGVWGNGTPILMSLVNEPVFGTAAHGVYAAGTSNDTKASTYRFTASGGAVLDSLTKSAIKDISYTASGGVSLSNQVQPQFVFRKTLKFLWNTNQFVQKDLIFNWNTGTLAMFWYRVVSKDISTSNCPLDPCCQKLVFNIHARTLAELCEKLSQRNFKFPIESVDKFSTPWSTGTSSSSDPACNKFIPVQVCSIPACADFCVDQDVRQGVKFSQFVQVNAFPRYVATGSAVMGGIGNASFTKVLPGISYTASGGFSLTGDANAECSVFTAHGGVYGAGSAQVTSSRYTYVGGIWPNTCGRRFGSTSESVSVGLFDNVWSLTERVYADDGLFAQTDISFNRYSEFLIVGGFNLGIPDWASITGIKVIVDRVATQIGVRDDEVYLMNGETVISDNLAYTSIDWPLIKTATVYGTNDGISEIQPWRDPTDTMFDGPIGPSDVNSPEFGVAIRVHSVSGQPVTIAKIDSISVEIFYENLDGSIVRISGTAGTVAPIQHYTGQGQISCKGSSPFRIGMRYVPSGLGSSSKTAITMGGTYMLGRAMVGSGGPVIDGQANCRPSFQQIDGSGGSIVSGEALVKPYIEFMAGGSAGDGTAKITANYRAMVSGSAVASGTAYVPFIEYRYSAKGSVVLGSAVSIRATKWKYAASGNVTVQGSADQRASTIGTPTQSIVFGMSILETNATFFSDVDLHNATSITSTIDRCGCLSIPLSIELDHNLASNNIFSQFLVRNNYQVPTRIIMRHNSTNDSWQSNLHYKGTSPDTNQPELWDFIFEIQCTNVVGGISVGANIWKVAIQVVRRSLVTTENHETRIVVAMLPAGICGLSGHQLNCKISYDTQLGMAVITPTSTVYQNTIFDNIGLFRNQYWLTNPDLTITITQSNDGSTSNRVDLTDSVLV